MPGAFPFVILFKGAKCAFDLPGFSEVQNAHLIFAPVQQEAFSAIVEFFRFWASFLIRGHTAHGTKMSYDIGSSSMDYSNRMTGLYGIYQYAAPTKAETLVGMKEIVPVIKDILTKAIVENAIRKLERIPEPECSQFIAATKARFLAERDNSIRQRLTAAKLQEPIMQGHDLSGKERFRPETRHMITLEVQKDCFVGFKGERFRFYLSDEGYHNAKHSEQEGEIEIKSHAAVVAGKLYPDKKPRQQER